MNNIAKAAVLATMLLVTLSVVIAVAEDDDAVNGEFDTGEFSGTYYDIPIGDYNIRAASIDEYKGAGGDVEIPTTVTIGGTEYPVNSLADGIFEGTSASVTSVSIPSFTALSVSKGAFDGVVGAEFRISDSNVDSIMFQIVESVGENNRIVFVDEQVAVDYSLDGGWLLDNGNTLVYVASWATGDIPEYVTSIWNTVKQDENNVEYSVTFQNCTIDTMTIPAGMTEISQNAFYCHSGLKSISFAGSPVSIGDKAFAGTGLTEIDIPDSVTSIGDRAFESSALERVDLPSNLANLDDAAFMNCEEISSFTIGGSSEVSGAKYTLKDNAIYETDGDAKGLLFVAPAVEGEFTVAEGTTSINAYAFQYSKAESVSLPETVTSIENDSFKGSTLIVIEAPGVTSLGSAALVGSQSLENIKVAEECSLADVSFNNTSLSSVTKGEVTYPVVGEDIGEEPLSWYTPGDPEPIETVADLLEFARIVNYGKEDFEGKTVRLVAGTIYDLTDVDWTPIGHGVRDGSGFTDESTPFRGTFVGNGCVITGLTITETTVSNAVTSGIVTSADKGDYALGLFGIIDGGSVSGVTLAGVSIEAASGELAGAVAGMVTGGGTISDCTVGSQDDSDGSKITTKAGSGGIVGRMTIKGTISGCTNYADVTGTGTNIGGIVGASYYSNLGMSITNCQNHGNVAGTSGVGGISGLSSATVSGCTNEGQISGNGTSVGGIVGEARGGASFSECVNKAAVSNSNTSAGEGGYGTGGIVGWIRYIDPGNYDPNTTVSVSSCTNEGDVTSVSIGAGGIIGMLYHSGIVDGNTSSGDVSGNGMVGGIVGGVQTTDSYHSKDACQIRMTSNSSSGTLSNSGTNTGTIVGHLTTLSAERGCTLVHGSYVTEYGNTSTATGADTDGFQQVGTFFTIEFDGTVHGYHTLSEAVAAAPTGVPVTIKVAEDVSGGSTTVIGVGKQITLDLCGNVLTFSPTKVSIAVDGADAYLKITDSGSEGKILISTGSFHFIVTDGTMEVGNVLIQSDSTVSEDQGPVFFKVGNATGGTAHLIIGEGAELYYNGGNVTDSEAETMGATFIAITDNVGTRTVDFSGEIHAVADDRINAGINVNGSISQTGNIPVVNVKGGEIDAGNVHAIYAAGYADYNITGGKLSGITGIEIRAGTLEVSGNAIIEGTGIPIYTDPNDNGSTTLGAGIAVVQHTTKSNIQVTVSGGEISGYNAFFENNIQGNTDDDIRKISLSITGGSFKAVNGGTQPIFVNDVSLIGPFVSGGTFNGEVPEGYCVNGFMVVETSQGVFEVMEIPEYGIEVDITPDSVMHGGTVTVTANEMNKSADAQLTYQWYIDGQLYDFDGLSFTYAVTADTTFTLKVTGTNYGETIDIEVQTEIVIDPGVTVTFTHQGEVLESFTIPTGSGLAEVPDVPEGAPEGYGYVWVDGEGYQEDIGGMVFYSDAAFSTELVLLAPDIDVAVSGPLYEGGSVTVAVTIDHPLADSLEAVYAYGIEGQEDPIATNDTGVFTVSEPGTYLFAVQVTDAEGREAAAGEECTIELEEYDITDSGDHVQPPAVQGTAITVTSSGEHADVSMELKFSPPGETAPIGLSISDAVVPQGSMTISAEFIDASRYSDVEHAVGVDVTIGEMISYNLVIKVPMPANENGYVTAVNAYYVDGDGGRFSVTARIVSGEVWIYTDHNTVYVVEPTAYAQVEPEPEPEPSMGSVTFRMSPSSATAEVLRDGAVVAVVGDGDVLRLEYGTYTVVASAEDYVTESMSLNVGSPERTFSVELDPVYIPTPDPEPEPTPTPGEDDPYVPPSPPVVIYPDEVNVNLGGGGVGTTGVLACAAAVCAAAIFAMFAFFEYRRR